MRRLAAGAALLLSVGALAGCGGDSDGGDDGAWPENVRSNFINACVAEDPAMEGYCGCMLEGLEEKYTIDEYIEVEREMEGSSGDQGLDEWGGPDHGVRRPPQLIRAVRRRSSFRLV